MLYMLAFNWGETAAGSCQRMHHAVAVSGRAHSGECMYACVRSFTSHTAQPASKASSLPGLVPEPRGKVDYVSTMAGV